MMDLMTSMAKGNKQTLIIVTHDLEISEYAHRRIYIADGKVEKFEYKEEEV